MYRIYVFMPPYEGGPEQAERWTGHSRYATYEQAAAQLDKEHTRGAIGGDIEVWVNGIGWCLAAVPNDWNDY